MITANTDAELLYQVVCLNPDCEEQYQVQHPPKNCDICGCEDIEVME